MLQEVGCIDTPQSIARAARITSLGSLSSRVVGFLRDTVRAWYFGNGAASSAYELAAIVPNQFNDLLAGGMLSSALVPTFSRALSEDDSIARRAAFGRLLGALIGLLGTLTGLLTLLLYGFSDAIAAYLSDGKPNTADVQQLLHITLPAIIFLNLSAVFTAALQAQRRFSLTAFTATVFNLVMIAIVVLFEARLGIAAMAIGMVAGSIAQLLMQLPGLRDVPIKLSLNLNEPGIRQILRLFLPVIGGLLLQQVAVTISFKLANRIDPDAGPASMRFAANIIQLPLGLISAALAAATLPALSSFALRDAVQFKATLARGLRLAAALIVPCVVGLWVLAVPAVGLIYERGNFGAESTAYTAIALRAAIPNLLFASLDRLLIFGFYARQNTRTPTLIGLGATCAYLLGVGVLSWLDSAGLRAFDLFDLILADSLKTGLDMTLMGALLWRAIGGLRGHGLRDHFARIALAALISGGATLLALGWVRGIASAGWLGHAQTVFLCGLAGGAAYLLTATLLRVPEVSLTRVARLIRRH